MESGCYNYSLKYWCLFAVAVLGLTYVAEVNAQTIVYSESFTQGASYCPSDPQYDNWAVFRTQLDTSAYLFTKVTIKGSLDTTGRSCTDTTAVNEMATALRNGVVGDWVGCNGNNWHVGTLCNTTCTVVGDDIEFTADGSNCSCTNPGYIVRPCIGNSNWGGINGSSCGATSQTLTVVFEYVSCSLYTEIVVIDPACVGGNGVIDLAVFDGAAPYTYSWSSGDTIEDPTGLGAGTHTVTVNDTDGCVYADSAMVTNPIIFNETVCSGDSVQLSADAMICFGNAPYTYDWGVQLDLSCTACENPYASPTQDTIFSVLVTDSSGGTTSVTVNLFVSSTVPIANAGIDSTLCQTDTLQLTGSGGTLYSWAPTTGLSDTSISNPYAYPSNTTSYILTAANGCGSDTDTVIITISPLPILITADTGICSGDTLALSASGAATYAWSPTGSLSDSTIGNPLAFPSVTTTYSVTATSSFGCVTNDGITLTMDSVPEIFAVVTNDTICPGGTTQLNVEGSSDCNDYDISTISFNPLSGSGTNVALSDDQVSTGLPIGFTFSFYCVDYTDFYISSNGFLTFTNSSDDGCCSGQTMPDAVAPNNLIAFAWEDIDPSSGGTINYFTTGTAPNRILAMNFIAVPHYSGGNNITTQVLLYEGANSIEIHTTTMPTDGGTHTMGIENIDGTIAHVVTGRNGSSTWSATNEGIRFSPVAFIDTTLNYTWSPGAGLSDSTVIDPIASPSTTTTYIVKALVGTCYTSDTITIYVDTNSAISINAISTDVCIGDSVLLDVTGTQGMPDTSTWTYGWTPTSGLSDTSGSATYAFPVSTTTYHVNVTNSCGSYTDSITLVSKNKPTANAGLDTYFCSGGSVQITASGGASYVWGPNAFLSCTACDKTNANPDDDMIYYVTATDSFGCSDKDSVLVEVYGLPITVTSDKTTLCAPGDSVNLSVEGISDCNAYDISTIAFNPLSSTGTNVSLGDDQVSTGLSIGFTFNFYCNDYTTFYISSNGFLTFSNGGDNGCCSGQIMPDTTAPNNLIAFAWEDLNPSSGGTITYTTSGSAPYRTLAMTFTNVPHFTGGNITVQVLLYESTNIIEIHSTSMLSTGGLHTMGIENIDGTIAHVVTGRNSDGTWSAVNEGIRFSPLTAPPLDTTLVYNWTPGASLVDSTASSTIASPSGGITYVVEVDDNGCIQTDSVSIFMDTTVISVVADTNICKFDAALLNVTSNTALSFYQWSPSTGLSDPTIQSPAASPGSTTEYTVTVTNSAGCQFTSDTVIITVDTVPAAAFTNTDTNLVASFTNSTINALSYLWDFGDGSQDSLVDPVHTYSSNGTYNVCLVAYNGCGSDTSCSSITVSLTGCANTVAAFDTSVSDLTVMFTDQSSDVTGWLWDFGDGNTSSFQSPTHVYGVDSTYNVCLITTNLCSSDTLCMLISVSSPIIPCVPTIANYSSNSVGLDAVFTDASSDATSWAWDFGDGNTSTQQNPVHTYAADSTYTICLIASNVCSADTICDTVSVSASNCTATVVNFSSSAVNLVVDFTDNSTDATVWSWDFGDGNTSNVANPSHTYGAAGTYTVCLIVSNPCSADSICDSITINACAAPTALFNSSENELTASFTDASTGAISWSWDFGDGNTSTSQNSSNIYSASGTYNVCLTVNSGCATDTYCNSITVASCPVATSVFTFMDSALSVGFNNTSANADTWFWDFGDGINSSAQNPTHVYGASGTYTVCLTASSTCDSITNCADVTVLSVGIDEGRSETIMDVYPNPTDGLLNLRIRSDITDQITVSIYNLIGEVVFFAEGPELQATNVNGGGTVYSLNLDNLASGSYLLKVQSNDKFYLEQIIFSK